LGKFCYSLVIATAVSIYYDAVTSDNNGIITVLGVDFNNSTLLSYSLSFSFFLIVAILSYLVWDVDYTGNKKKFLVLFVIWKVGVSVLSLFFFLPVKILC
jgi:UMF1 family MFS transporter